MGRAQVIESENFPEYVKIAKQIRLHSFIFFQTFIELSSRVEFSSLFYFFSYIIMLCLQTLWQKLSQLFPSDEVLKKTFEDSH
jgi:hypothetical protein